MRPYLAIIKARTSVLLQYRAAALAGIGSQLFWGVVKVMILTAFFSQSTAPQPITLKQAIIMVWLGQIFMNLLPWVIDEEIGLQIKTGGVAYELARPLHLYWLWFYRSMATKVIPTLIHASFLIPIALIFLGLPFPCSSLSGVAFGISMGCSAILSTAMTTIIVISLFWTLCGEGIQKILPHTSLLLSGTLIPLPLFPEWLQFFFNIQPFRGIIDIPYRIYSGIVPSSDAYLYISFQLLWSLIFIVLGQWLLKKATKRLVIQGG